MELGAGVRVLGLLDKPSPTELDPNLLFSIVFMIPGGRQTTLRY